MYKKMSTLAGVAILMVVAAHSIQQGIWALYAWTERYQHMLPQYFNPYVDPFNTPQWYFLVFGQTFVVPSVPSFFAISGFFIAFAIDKTQENIRWETIKKRIVGLFSPYLVWTIILTILGLIQNKTMLPIDFFLRLFGVVGGLWFIPTIILFYFLSPLLIFLAQKNWKLLLLSSGLLQILLIIIKYIFFANINAQLFRRIIYGSLEQLFVYSMFFFVLGIVIGMKRSTFMNWLDRFRVQITIVCIVLLLVISAITSITRTNVISENYWNNIIVHILQRFYALSFILMFLTFDDEKIPFSKWLKKVGFKTFGIYLAHYSFLIVFSKAIYHFLPILLYYQILFTSALIFVSVLGPILLMSIVKRLPFKSLYPYLFG